ncbi:hypothetical protein Tco_1014453 [Tanacetum coccineum]
MADHSWIESMQDELNQFKRLQVWELIPRLEGKNVIALKWLWKNKCDAKNIVVRNKSRNKILCLESHRLDKSMKRNEVHQLQRLQGRLGRFLQHCEILTKQVSQDIMEEVSLTINEAKLKKMADEMLRQRCTSGDEHQYHIDQMKNFLKSDIVWESKKEILVSLHP